VEIPGLQLVEIKVADEVHVCCLGSHFLGQIVSHQLLVCGMEPEPHTHTWCTSRLLQQQLLLTAHLAYYSLSFRTLNCCLSIIATAIGQHHILISSYIDQFSHKSRVRPDIIMNARVLGDKITHCMCNQSLLNNTLVNFQLNLEFNISHVTYGAAAAASPQSLEIVLLVDQVNSTYKQDL